MPAWGKHMDDEAIWGIVALLRQLPDLSEDRYHALVEASGGHSHGHDEHESQIDESEEPDVPAEGKAAVATVDRFFAALSAGDIDRAGAELDPQVIILESGGAEHSAAEYLGGHAKDDAEFLKTAQQKLGHRTVRVIGKLAWIASESELKAKHDGKPITLFSTETMVLRSTDSGWKIVHIHWSSQTGK